MTCDTDRRHGLSASHRPRTAPCPQQGNGRFRRRQTAHPSRVPGTAIRAEDCAFPQMTEAPPESSGGERSPRRESTFSISPPSPTHHRSVTIGDFSEPTSLAPPHSPSPQPALTSTDAPRHSARLPVDAVPPPEKSPIVTPVRRSDRPAPMWRHPSARQPGTHERPARRRWQPTHLRHPHAHRAVRPAASTSVTPDHTPRPHSTSQVTLDLWTIRSLPDRR